MVRGEGGRRHHLVVRGEGGRRHHLVVRGEGGRRHHLVVRGEGGKETPSSGKGGGGGTRHHLVVRGEGGKRHHLVVRGEGGRRHHLVVRGEGGRRRFIYKTFLICFSVAVFSSTSFFRTVLYEQQRVPTPAAFKANLLSIVTDGEKFLQGSNLITQFVWRGMRWTSRQWEILKSKAY